METLRPSQKTSTLKVKAKASAMLGRIGPLKKTEHTYERVRCSVAGEGRRGHREVIHTHEFHTWIRRKTTHAPLPPQARAAAAGQVRVHGRTVRAWQQRSTQEKSRQTASFHLERSRVFSQL